MKQQNTQSASKKLSLFRRIGFKLSIFFTCTILLVGVFSVVYMSINNENVMKQTNEERSKMALTTMQSVLETYQTESQTAAKSLAEYAAIVQAVETGSSTNIKAAAAETVKLMGLDVDFVTITDTQGVVVARTRSDKTGDSIVNQKNISMALAGKTTTHTDLGTEIPLSIRTGAPITDTSGKIIGVLSTGYSLTNPDFVDKLKNMTGNDFTIFIGDERANTTITANGKRVSGTKLDPKIAQIVLKEKASYLGEADILGNPYATAYAPILDDNGEAIGVSFAGVSLTAIRAAMQTATTNSAVFLLLLWILVTIILTIYIRKSISKPLIEMSEIATQMSNGNLAINLRHHARDELGILADALRTMVCALQHYIGDITEKLGQMSHGDLRITVDLDYVGDFAVIKQEMEHIAAELNATLREIDTTADQVNSGAKMIADSSNHLSQGATEQASSVEELTASLDEVTTQTSQNANHAQAADTLTKQIKSDAETGNAQMMEMLHAMDEINLASDNISKIIKAIEDIAFQTNILSLNAGVEAARAGQHGRGFAVVAEEVRTLAAQASSASKETADLIEHSLLKVKAGTKIANETAGTLGKITADVSKASDLVNAIAIASNDQAAALEQINQGIVQVSQVVQGNATTSEEYAAASEELSSQADGLKESIRVFQLDTGNESPSGISVPEPNATKTEPILSQVVS